MSNPTINLFLILGIFTSSVYTGGDWGYNGSTEAPVAVVAGVFKSKNNPEPESKYKRKDCPVCKGKGYYKSGDGIKDVECGYCEPEEKEAGPGLMPKEPDELVHPPVIIKSEPKEGCHDGKCAPPSTRIYRK